MAAENMKTADMSLFLRQVSKAHGNHFIIMVVDGASARKSSNSAMPKNVSIIVLPPYSPELDPVERVWNILRRDYITDKYFDTSGEVIDEAEEGLQRMKSQKEKIKSLTCWPWIITTARNSEKIFAVSK
jgi:transposase